MDEASVIIEELNDKYRNVVIVEEEKYTLQWLFKINASSSKYHVYLSEEMYDILQDGDVIYEQ